MGRPRSTEARQKVVEAMIEVLLSDGVEGATVEEVSARSGVAKSTIYRHFGTRESLMIEAVSSCITPAPTPDTGSLADDLFELFDRYDDEANERVNELFPLLLDAARRDPSMRETVDELLAERKRPMRTVIQLAQLRGEVDADLDLDVAVAMVIGPLTYWRMVLGREISDDLVSTVVQGGVAALKSTVADQVSAEVSSTR